MDVMAICVVDPQPGLAQQVYLWYQENTLMGEAALLMNPCPGIKLAASDLVRNLVLAPLLSMGTDSIDDVMREHWLPLESKFENTIKFNEFLQRFVDQRPLA